MSLRPADSDGSVFSLRNVIPSSDGPPLQLGREWEHDQYHEPHSPLGLHVPAPVSNKKMFNLNFAKPGVVSGINTEPSARSVCGRECEARVQAMAQQANEHANRSRRSESQIALLDKQLHKARQELSMSVTKYNQASASAAEDRKQLKTRIHSDGKLIVDLKSKIATQGQDNMGLVEEVRGIKKKHMETIDAHSHELDRVCMERDEATKRFEERARIAEEAQCALRDAQESHKIELFSIQQRCESAQFDLETCMKQAEAASNDHGNKINALNETVNDLRESLSKATCASAQSDISMRNCTSSHRAECDVLRTNFATLEAKLAQRANVSEVSEVPVKSPPREATEATEAPITSLKHELVELRVAIDALKKGNPTPPPTNDHVLAEISTLRTQMFDMLSEVRGARTTAEPLAESQIESEMPDAQPAIVHTDEDVACTPTCCDEPMHDAKASKVSNVSVASVLLSHRDAISALVPGTVSFGAARGLVGTVVGDAAFAGESVGASAQSDAVRAAVGDFKHIAQSHPNTQALESGEVSE